MPPSLLPTRFLFRFSAPCRRREPPWTPEGEPLDESFRLIGLAALEDRAVWADVRAAWSEAGLIVAVEVRGKKQPLRQTSLEDRSGLGVWINTRDVHDIHRAGRFCHRFFFAPDDKGAKTPISEKSERKASAKARSAKKNSSDPFFPAAAQWLPINRAREEPHPLQPESLRARWRPLGDGYILEAYIPAGAMTGFDPAEHPRLGFTYAVFDRELGQQTFGVGSPMPYQEDPGLWATLELVN